MSEKKKLTRWDIDLCKRWLAENRPDIECLDDIYVNNSTNMRFSCLTCGHSWGARWGNIHHGRSCPKCAIKRRADSDRLSLTDVKNKLYKINQNIEILDNVYTNSQTKMRCKCLINSCGHEWYVHWSNLNSGRGCPKCSNRIKLTIEDIKSRLETINPNIECMDDARDEIHPKMNFKCKLDGYEWNADFNSVLQKHGCPKCAGNMHLSVEEVIYKISILNPNIVMLDDIYKNASANINFKCLIDGHEWKASWSNISRGNGCPECGKIKSGVARRLTDEEAMLKFKDSHNGEYDYSLVKYINNSTKVKIRCKKCDKVFLQTPATHWKGSGCIECSHNKPHTEESIVLKFKEKHGDDYIYDRLNFKGVKHDIKVGCKVDGHGYFKCNAESHMRGASKCPICYPFNFMTYGSIAIERPDLIKYFKNKSDIDKYSMRSSIKLEMICPDCGEQKITSPSNLFKNGFKCAICSDGISMPEKFCINMLKSIGVDFIRQKSFDWSEKKRYDFYIPSMDLIIETHGIQHYIFSGMGATPDIVQANDNNKYKLAIDNGIVTSKYVVINCANSSLEWFKENFILSLQNHIRLDDVDWNDVWIKSQKSMVTQAWDMWKNKTSDITSRDLANKFQVHTSTIVEWLKSGAVCGTIEYDPIEEMRKCQRRTVEEMNRQVYQSTLDGEVVHFWKSLYSVNKKLNLRPKYINQCARGELESYGGFKWSYETTGG